MPHLDTRKLRQLRMHRNLSQLELANRLGISSSGYARYEHPTYTGIDDRMIAGIAKELGCKVADLTFRAGNLAHETSKTIPRWIQQLEARDPNDADDDQNTLLQDDDIDDDDQGEILYDGPAPRGRPRRR